MYAMDISFSRAGSVEYYLTATDEAGNKSKSESRQIKIEDSPPPPPRIYQGIMGKFCCGRCFHFWFGMLAFRLAYLREGKTHPT